jgi:streptomycin 6-kinase
MPAITIQYDLHPPTGVTTASLSPTKKHDFTVATQVQPTDQTDQKAFYEGLRKAIAESKATLGNELTQWRDAVGKAEAEKEKRKAVVEDNTDEEEDEADDRDGEQ